MKSTNIYNLGLTETLKDEKRQRGGKKPNLLGKEGSDVLLFHSSKVRAAQAYAAEKEAKEQAKKAAGRVRRAQATADKRIKDEEAEEKAV
jgi:hypothetical protein